MIANIPAIATGSKSMTSILIANTATRALPVSGPSKPRFSFQGIDRHWSSILRSPPSAITRDSRVYANADIFQARLVKGELNDLSPCGKILPGQKHQFHNAFHTNRLLLIAHHHTLPRMRGPAEHQESPRREELAPIPSASPDQPKTSTCQNAFGLRNHSENSTRSN